jgi:hypothetical protein
VLSNYSNSVINCHYSKYSQTIKHQGKSLRQITPMLNEMTVALELAKLDAIRL